MKLKQAYVNDEINVVDNQEEINNNFVREALKDEFLRLLKRRDEILLAPKYCQRNNTYEVWYYSVLRLGRQIEACKRMIGNL